MILYVPFFRCFFPKGGEETGYAYTQGNRIERPSPLKGNQRKTLND